MSQDWSQSTGLSIVMDANARSVRGVFEHLQETETHAELLERLQEVEQMCRSLADDLTHL